MGPIGGCCEGGLTKPLASIEMPGSVSVIVMPESALMVGNMVCLLVGAVVMCQPSAMRPLESQSPKWSAELPKPAPVLGCNIKIVPIVKTG